MSVYFNKKKGWRYDFVVKGSRFSQAGFKTKTEAKRAEAQRREEVLQLREKLQDQEQEQAPGQRQSQATAEDMAFLDLVNLRLDHVKAYHADCHYRETLYCARRWVKRWKELKCCKLTERMITTYMIERRKVSAHAANKDLRFLRSLFNFGKKKKFVTIDPTEGVDFFPIDKVKKYVPEVEDILKVISAAEPEVQDYLLSMLHTLGRMSEINNLKWEDVDLKKLEITLYTRKKRGGGRTPRTIQMTDTVFQIMRRRSDERDPSMPWVFWHRYWSRNANKIVTGKFNDRKSIMTTLCKKAGVRYFRFHPLRHCGASVMNNMGVPIGVIQRILGHKNRTTTEIYLHTLGQGEKEAMRVLEQACEGKVPHFFPHQEDRGHGFLQ